MYIILMNETGGAMEGVILAVGRNVMRVSVRGLSDTLELRQADGVWISDGGGRFEIDALVADTDATMSDLGSALRARTLTASMQFFG
jgi:hypothetical protein